MRTRLPAEVLRHPKWGFGVPWSPLMRKDPALMQLLNELPDREPILSSPLNRQTIREVVRKFLAGSDEAYLLLLQLLMISVWYRVTFSAKRSSELVMVSKAC